MLTMVKSSVKGRSSERIAEGILDRLGYEILERNKKIAIDETEAFEVDFIVKGSKGVKYSVEVKAGRASVSDLRQIYADSKILNLRPMIVCKDLADDAAKAVAEELKIKVLKFSEYFMLLEPEELETIVRSAMRDVLNEYGLHPIPPLDAIEKSDMRILRKVASGSTVNEAAEELDLNIESLGMRFGEMRRKGILPKQPQDFATLRKYCQQIIYRYDLLGRLERIEKELRKWQSDKSNKTLSHS